MLVYFIYVGFCEKDDKNNNEIKSRSRKNLKVVCPFCFDNETKMKISIN